MTLTDIWNAIVDAIESLFRPNKKKGKARTFVLSGKQTA